MATPKSGLLISLVEAQRVPRWIATARVPWVTLVHQDLDDLSWSRPISRAESAPRQPIPAEGRLHRQGWWL
jgi:hypothetical protein